MERLFGILQSRLPIELKLTGIKNTEQANEFLASYLKKINAQFALGMDCIKSVFEKQPYEEKIDRFLALLRTGYKKSIYVYVTAPLSGYPKFI